MRFTSHPHHSLVMYAKKTTWILFFFCSCVSYGQEPFKEYLDKNMVKTDTLAKAVYYRVGKRTAERMEGKVKTYYTNNRLQGAENYSKGRRNGVSISYYRNGKKSTKSRYDSGIGTGKHFKWYENGHIWEEGEWIYSAIANPNPSYRVTGFWDSIGVRTLTNGTGELVEYTSEGKVWIRETYQNGILIKGVSNPESSQPYYYDSARETPPVFPGGVKTMFDFLKNNTKYPDKAVGIISKGKVYVQFTIDSNGTVKDIETTGTKLGYGCEEEAMRVISMMPKWSPGIQYGKPVPVRYFLPFMFNNVQK